MSDRTTTATQLQPGRWSAWLAWSLLGLSIVISLASMPLALAVGDIVDGYINPTGIVLVVVAWAWVATGALIVSRQPGNWAGWLFCFIGLALSFSSLVQSYTVYGLRISSGSLPLLGLAAWLNEYVYLALAFIPLLFLLFPDGHVPSRGWRWAMVGLLGGMGLAFVAFFVRAETFNNLRDWEIEYENPFGIEALGQTPGTAIAIGTMIALASAVACVLGLRYRFKRSSGEERQQMRWLVFVGSLAAALLLVLIAFVVISEAANIEGSAPIFPALLAFTAVTVAFGVPAAFLIAILRYRLYALDLVIRKTVIVGSMAVFIAVVYGAIVGGLGALIGSKGGPTLSFLGATVLAIVFQPARERARRLADRVVYGKRATPYEVLTEFSERVGETYASDDVLARMAKVLAEGTGAEAATVWLRIGTTHRAEATWPDDATAPTSLPEDAVEVRHGGGVLGALSARMPASDPMNPAKEKLVADLASQAGLVLRNVRLIEELRASRQRLVTAQDEERRRLERNIHDGAQQQLVALTVKLRLAQGLVAKDAMKAEEMLSALQAETQTALEDLRDLARGIYPPLLADKGLTAALEAQARRAPIPVEVRGEDVGRYGQDVEAAVYFCTLEALNNIAKYAGASRASIALEQANGHLTFTVVDDGRGFDAEVTSYGTGLQGMADRLDAIGGTLGVRSSPGSGTSVTGRVPVRSETTS